MAISGSTEPTKSRGHLEVCAECDGVLAIHAYAAEIDYHSPLGAVVIRDIELRRAELEALCHHFRVRSLEVFGSAATGHLHGGTSDLGFLVEFDPQADVGYADMYFGLLESLGALFGRPVDLIVASTIRNPYFRQAVDRSRTQLYAA